MVHLQVGVTKHEVSVVQFPCVEVDCPVLRWFCDRRFVNKKSNNSFAKWRRPTSIGLGSVHTRSVHRTPIIRTLEVSGFM